ncbi:MAG: serine/threonine-protein kinase HipA [Flavobacteriales bacterium]|jgi:serine/threonine-protein kinase HipA
MSSAKIRIWNTTVGYLYWDDPNQTALFEPDAEYLNSNINISPVLHPDKQDRLTGSDYHNKFNGLIPTFNDSLPDSFGNTVFKEWLEQMKMDQSEMNPVERLLYIGSRGIGALEYQTGKHTPNTLHSFNLNDLADISNKIIRRKYAQEDFLHDPEALSNILTIGSSVGGAQAKILVAQSKDGKSLAGDLLHDQPVDYFIVKLEHEPENVWSREKNYVEHVYNAIARDAGINVAESKLIFEGGRAHFASKRFDRVGNKKVHKQTVNALRGFWGKSLEFGYSDIFKTIEFLQLPYANTEQLFMQMVFNVAASNRDDHTKNFSFLMDKDGYWALSPAYDLTFPRDPYGSFNSAHQIHINGKTKDILREDIVAVAELVGVRNYNQIIDNVIHHVSSFSEKIKGYPLESNTTKLIAKDIAGNIDRLK